MSIEDVLAELDDYFCTETRQPGDLDTETLAAHYGISRNSVRDKMEEIAKDGKFTVVVIRENGRRRKVLRKKDNA